MPSKPVQFILNLTACQSIVFQAINIIIVSSCLICMILGGACVCEIIQLVPRLEDSHRNVDVMMFDGTSISS